MTKAEKLAKAYSGLLGDEIVVKKGRRGNNVIALAKKRNTGAPTDKQLATRERLSLAARYGRLAMEVPELRDLYTNLSQKGLPPFRVACNDYLQKPVIRNVDHTGYLGKPSDTIHVVAFDRIRLKEVRVELIMPDGTPVESGICVQDLPTGDYIFTATCQVADTTGVIVIARVVDLPGNVVTKSVTL
jgi:hypothetical protein